MAKSNVLKRAWLACLALGLAAATGLGGNAVAMTPDDGTPANEGVCDVLKGGTAGLYGLCVAYCEAQDLDLVGDKETPNTKILANYRKKMQPGDPDMPCMQVPCPCWNAGQLANVGSASPATCTVSGSSAQIRVLTPEISQQATATISPQGNYICRFVDTTTTPLTSVRFTITEAEYGSCRGQVLDKCASLGQ